MRVRARLTIVLGALAALQGAACAQSPTDFYRGKTINVIVGFSAGDGTDTWARLIARRLGTHMPGSPQIVVTNVPGAGSLLATNQLANTQPRDGTVIAAINRGMPFEPLLGAVPTQFDSRTLNWLGSPDRDTAVCVARKDARVKSLEDLRREELIVGSTGSGADTATIPAVLREVLSLRFKTVTGYPGSRDILLAIERNEVQGICVNYDSLAREPVYRNNLVNILFQAAAKSDERLTQYPAAIDFARNERERQALRLFFQRAEIGRPFVAPPGVPADRLAALRKAFAETLADADLAADAAQAGLNLRPVSFRDTIDIIENVYRTPKDVVDEMKQAFGQGG